ncbi:MAG: IS5 family transposase [Thermoleophilia bacterium]
MGQPGFFDLDERYESLSKCGDPLEMLAKEIPWESFRSTLRKALKKPRKSSAGRKAFDCVLMFKVMVLQSLYNLSDQQMEFMIRDRLSFMRFLGLNLGSRVPDEKTIWLFKDTLAQRKVTEKLFARFDGFLAGKGYTAKKGQIVDASFVEVPRQRNNRQENQTIKNGEVPGEWQDQPHKLCQKDTDARWTRKGGISYYGYKNHINTDVKYKLVRGWAVTPASVHDSQVFERLLDKKNSRKAVWADSAYRSDKISEKLKGRYHNLIHYRGYRDHPLSEAKQEVNRKRSKTRARVEHVFGFQATSMGGKLIRCVGQARATLKIGMRNLTYNMCRYTQLLRSKTA